MIIIIFEDVIPIHLLLFSIYLVCLDCILYNIQNFVFSLRVIF